MSFLYFLLFLQVNVQTNTSGTDKIEKTGDNVGTKTEVLKSKTELKKVPVSTEKSDECNCECNCSGEEKSLTKDWDNSRSFIFRFAVGKKRSTDTLSGDIIHEFSGFKYVKPLLGVGMVQGKSEDQSMTGFYLMTGVELISGSFLFNRLRIFMDISIAVGIFDEDAVDGGETDTEEGFFGFISGSAGVRYRLNQLSISAGVQYTNYSFGFITSISYSF